MSGVRRVMYTTRRTRGNVSGSARSGPCALCLIYWGRLR